MTPKPKFSFVIAVYNPPEDLFRRCLDSCLSQEGVDFEIVAVNDGSTNNAANVLDEYAHRHLGVFKIVTQENKGNGPAKKAGIENASGEFLWLVDQDDRVRPNSIRPLVDALEQHGADQVLFKAVRVDEADADRPFPLCSGFAFRLVSREYVFASGCRAFWKRIVRKSVVDKSNVDIPFSPQDDRPATIRWTLESSKILETDCVNYFWIQNSASITHAKYYRPEFLKSSLKTLELLHKHSEDFPEFKRWMVLEIFRCARANLKRLRQSRKMPEAKTPAVQQQFRALEAEYGSWLNRYSDDDRMFVFAEDEATASLKTRVKSLTCKVRVMEAVAKKAENVFGRRLSRWMYRLLEKALGI